LGFVKINDKLKIALGHQKRKIVNIDNKEAIKKRLKKIEKNYKRLLGVVMKL